MRVIATTRTVVFVAFLYFVFWKWTHRNRLCVLQVNYNIVLQSCDWQVGHTRAQDPTIKFALSQRFILRGHLETKQETQDCKNDVSVCNLKRRPSVSFQTLNQEYKIKNKDDKSNTFPFLLNDDAYLVLNGMFVECIDLEHCALLVEIELHSGGQLLLLWGEVLCERGGKDDGALRDGRATSHTPSEPGIPTDLQHIWDMNRKTHTPFYFHLYYLQKQFIIFIFIPPFPSAVIPAAITTSKECYMYKCSLIPG